MVDDSQPVEAFDQRFRFGWATAPHRAQNGALFRPRGATDGQTLQDRDLHLGERLAGLRGDEPVPAVRDRTVHDCRQKM